jgi:hypothetical protein
MPFSTNYWLSIRGSVQEEVKALLNLCEGKKAWDYLRTRCTVAEWVFCRTCSV